MNSEPALTRVPACAAITAAANPNVTDLRVFAQTFARPTSHGSIAVDRRIAHDVVRTCVLPLLLLLSLPATSLAFDTAHVRPNDSRMQIAIADGVAHSLLFRDLVAQLEASDVIVYVESDWTMPDRIQGRLTFMSWAGGRRYVMIRIAQGLTGVQQVAIIAHELQHALEIANADSVVDETTMAAEYRRIGFTSGAVKHGAGYDSRAAIEMGQRVWEELNHRGE